MSTSMLGAPFSAYGAIQQGKSTAASLEAQAKNLQQQSDEALQKGQYDAMREQMVSGQKIGASIAAYGASGVTTDSGSVLDVIHASTKNAELDRLNILHGADIRAINYQNQAAMNRLGAESAIKGSYWQALGSITGGAITSAQDARGSEAGGGAGAASKGAVTTGESSGLEAGSGEAVSGGETSAAAFV